MATIEEKGLQIFFLSSDSSMADGYITFDNAVQRGYVVQIPLWPMATLGHDQPDVVAVRSDSSMADGYGDLYPPSFLV